MNIDEDALVAAIDLVGRSGARDVEIGYLHEGVPLDQAGWYATATYKGAKLIADDHKDPVAASEALARRILDGGQCAHCRKPIALGGPPDPAVCRWTRRGPRWVRACEPNRAARRRAGRRR